MTGLDVVSRASYLTKENLFLSQSGPLPVALSNAETGTYGAVNYLLLLAGAVIAMIPCVVVYVSLQRYHVRGLVSGGLKGSAAVNANLVPPAKYGCHIKSDN